MVPWLIQSHYLDLILSIVQREGDPESLLTRQGEYHAQSGAQVYDNVAVLDLTGPVFRYANLFTQISGATSLEKLSLEFQALVDDAEIDTIILNIDSPGGEANGISEFADLVYNARSVKNIIAYVGGTGASAAYWIASAADKIYIAETAEVGSIGTVISFIDDSENLKKEGYRRIEIVSTKSPDKRPDYTTDEGQQKLLRRANNLTEIFISKVARNRNVSTETVESEFGRGDVLQGTDAIQAGMADGLASLSELINIQLHVKESENIMSEFSFQDITKEQLQKERPDLAEQFRMEGEKSEQNRIAGILENFSSHLEDAEIRKTVTDGVSTAGDVALLVYNRREEKRTQSRTDLEEDANEIPAIGNSEEIPTDDEQVRSAASRMAQMVNQGRI